jgi:hypothetical protein
MRRFDALVPPNRRGQWREDASVPAAVCFSMTTSTLVAFVVGAAAGLGLGWLSERLPLPPVFQTISAAALGSFVASFAAAMLWMIGPPRPVDIKAVTFGVAEALVPLAIVVVAMALHFFLASSLVVTRLPTVAAHRGIVAGVVGAVFGVASFSLGLGIGEKLGR